MGLEPRTLSKLVFNVFSPALVFVSLVNSALPAGELLQLALFALVNILGMGLIAWLTGRLLRLSRTHIIVLILVVMFVNGGNYGLTLNQLRYGEEGLSRAIVYFMVSTVLVYTLGVFIASSGRQSWQASLRGLLRVPAVYAVAAALLVYSFSLPVPGFLMSGLEVAAEGAIPVMLIVLGMQMVDLQKVGSLRFTTLAAFLRLVVGALVAIGLATMLQLEGLGRATAIIEGSMPTAVITIILATEYDVQPVLVTGIVLLSTLLSPITVALTIQLLGL